MTDDTDVSTPPRLTSQDLQRMAHRSTTQVYRVFIRTTPQAIWEAITLPEWTVRYGYTGRVEADLRPGGAYRVRPGDGLRNALERAGQPVPDPIMEGEVIEAEPPWKLVYVSRMLMDPEMAAEPLTRVSYDIADRGDGTCSLTLTHELEGSPRLAAVVSGDLHDVGAGGGHPWMLSDLKTLLETGRSLAS